MEHEQQQVKNKPALVAQGARRLDSRWNRLSICVWM